MGIIRRFTGRRAISRIGTKTVIRFPETPFGRLYRMAASTDTSSPLVLSAPILHTVDTVLEGERAIRESALEGYKDFFAALWVDG